MARTTEVLCAIAITVAMVSCGTPPAPKPAQENVAAPSDLKKIEHVIVIYQENWSFDGLYGKFPGANGLMNAQSAVQQVDKSDVPLKVLPQVTDSFPPAPDTRFPPANGAAALSVEPYDLTKYVAADQRSGDLIHRFYHEQLQIDHGKMDKFVTWSDNGGLVMSYLDASELPEGILARKYVLCDNFFHSGFGGSFFNHQYFVAAAPPRWQNPPAKLISDPDPAHLNDNIVIRDTPDSNDGFAVNTVYSVNMPYPNDITDKSQLLPSLTNPTIGDRLSDNGVSWKWYAGGWNDAIRVDDDGRNHADKLFQFHHQPFVYYERYKEGSAERKEHLQDETDFLKDLSTDKLPAVSFIKPLGNNNEHPGYAAVLQGQQHVAELVDAVVKSSIWNNSVIIITYDENGGRWDHVAPPVIDRFGPGTRVPTIIISPFAKTNFVDHTQYETLSILSFLELRFGLKPLTDRDAKAAPLTNAFDFRQ